MTDSYQDKYSRARQAWLLKSAQSMNDMRRDDIGRRRRYVEAWKHRILQAAQRKADSNG